MKEVGKSSPLPSVLTVEARGMSEATKTILNPAIRFKDGGPSWSNSSPPLPLLSPVPTVVPNCHVCTEAAGLLLSPHHTPLPAQDHPTPEDVVSCSLSLVRLGAASPPRSSLKPRRVLSPVPLSKQSAAAFGTNTRVKSWQPRRILAHCVWGQERGGRAGGRLCGGGGGWVGGAWRDFPSLDPSYPLRCTLLNHPEAQ